MKIRILLTLFCMAMAFGLMAWILPANPFWVPPYPIVASPPLQTVTPDGWDILAPGIHYREFHLPDPNNVYVARMERDVLSTTIESSLAQGHLGAFETVSNMAARYDQAINYWGQAPLTPTWGTRSDVIVAINGSYYTKTTGVPWNGVVQSGWYAKRFDDRGGGTGFAWKLSREAFIGECAYHRPEKQLITLISGTQTITQTFQGINVLRQDDQLIIYTPQYGSHTGTEDMTDTVEVLVEMTRPTLILPTPAMAKGVVREIRDGAGATRLPFDHMVLSAHGEARQALLAHLELGMEIGVSQEITHYKKNCVDPLGLSWLKTYASVGGAFYFLNNGDIQSSTDPGATARNPRTAIAFNDEYIYFIVVDGRDEHHLSAGMTIDELAIFSRDTLSATYGIAQDGGGSSTMVVNGEVMNNTFCNNYFCNAVIFLPITSKPAAPPPSPRKTYPSAYPPPGAEPAAPTGYTGRSSADTQRAVANGMMMVIVQPKEQSTTFEPGAIVTTHIAAQVWLGPGVNYAPISAIPINTQGTIVAHALNGVLAKGSYWWKVDFGGQTVGWVPEETLLPETYQPVKQK